MAGVRHDRPQRVGACRTESVQLLAPGWRHPGRVPRERQMALAVLAALASAVCFALGAALQHREAIAVTSGGVADPRLLWKLCHRPLWLVGTLADLGSMALHV